MAGPLPTALSHRLGDYDPSVTEEELAHIQDEIDAIAFDSNRCQPSPDPCAVGCVRRCGSRVIVKIIP
ncbi:MAG: hypothetical protein EP309_09000 [Gammaproteobacteria bacterium]|nr:MAG: hypothetical protein EP309_09000 [Gammaproteobacteria bacterium]